MITDASLHLKWNQKCLFYIILLVFNLLVKFGPLFWKLWVHWTPAHSKLDGTLETTLHPQILIIWHIIILEHPIQEITW